MENALESYEYKGIKINIFADESPESPRTWDNLGKIILIGDNYSEDINETELSKYEIEEVRSAGSEEGMYKLLEKHFPKSVVLPIYRYAHSGVSYNTTGYDDRWDSCQKGFIIATREDILKEYSCKNITKSIRYRAENCLRHEVNAYSQYASGQIYGFVLSGINDEEIDTIDTSCWGFYGFDYCKQEAETTADYVAPLWIKQEPVRAYKAYKEMIEAAGQYNLL